MIIKRLKFLFLDTTFYGGAAALSKAFGLISFPLLTNYMSVEDYGTVDYLLVLSNLIAIFCIFGQDSAVGRYFYEYEDLETRKQVISQSLTFQIFILFVFLPTLWFFLETLSGALIQFDNKIMLLKLVLLQVPCVLFINFAQNIFKWTFARWKFLAMTIGYSSVHICILYLTVVVFDSGIEGVLLSSLISSAAFAFLALILVYNWLEWPKNFLRLLEMIPFAAPYGIICVIGAAVPSIERTIIHNLLDARSLGLFATGVKISMIMGLFVTAFQTAWGPFALSIFKEENAGNVYNLILKIFTLIVCTLALCIGIASDQILLFLAPSQYLGAQLIVFPLVMALAVNAVGAILDIGIGLSKKSYLSIVGDFAGILVSLLGIYFFALLMGLLGVGLGILCGQIVKSLIASWLSQKAYPLSWQYLPVIILVFITLFSGVTSTWLYEIYDPFFSKIVYLAAIILVPFVGFKILLSEDEKIHFHQFLKKRVYSNLD